MCFPFAGESNSAQTSHWIGRSFKSELGHDRSFTILIRKNVTGTGFEVCEGRRVKMPDHRRRMAIALMTRWFEHVQVGGAFNDTIFAIFSKDSPLGGFADGDMISFDDETLYELADRDYGLDVWALLPSHAACELIENAVHGNSPMRAGTAAIASIKGYMREHIKLLEQTAKLFAEAQKQPAATKTAAELSSWRQALAKLTAATYPAKRHHPTIANL